VLGRFGGAQSDRLLNQRPGLLAALSALRQRNACILLVARRDRLARDVLVAALVERLAERDGATVQAADGPAEGTSPEAVLMRRIIDAFAEYERLVVRARTRAALALKRSRGERTGGIPYGCWLVGTRWESRYSEPCELPDSNGMKRMRQSWNCMIWIQSRSRNCLRPVTRSRFGIRSAAIGSLHWGSFRMNASCSLSLSTIGGPDGSVW
jgi:hypothetical protein